jgi:transcriptional regulator GlxA family with amidase domain
MATAFPALAHSGPTSVGFLLIPGFALMSYAAAAEPLRAANVLAGHELYQWHHLTVDNRLALASNGMSVMPDLKLADAIGALDMLFVCAGGDPSVFSHSGTFAWLRKLARRDVIIGGISGGPYILAKAGLLAGRRCTLHWEHVPSFREHYPDLKVTRSLYEIDGDRITCSGGIAGLDMMVQLIKRQHGRDLATAVSDWFVHTQLREGPAPHRMDAVVRHGITDARLSKVLTEMEKHLEQPIARARLAKIAGVSVRQLERLFRRYLNHSVHKHYLSARLDHARKLLRETRMPITEVALATGFGSVSHFGHAYRRRFGHPASAANVGAKAQPRA